MPALTRRQGLHHSALVCSSEFDSREILQAAAKLPAYDWRQSPTQTTQHLHTDSIYYCWRMTTDTRDSECQQDKKKIYRLQGDAFDKA